MACSAAGLGIWGGRSSTIYGLLCVAQCCAILCCVPCPPSGGKLLVMHGGICRTNSPAHDGVGREVAVLNVDTMMWDKPGTARAAQAVHCHTATVVGRTKVLVLGGIKGESSSSDVSILNTDTMKWMVPQVSAATAPSNNTFIITSFTRLIPRSNYARVAMWDLSGTCPG